MDSINSEKPRTSLKSKNSTTNTEPSICGFCGCGMYVPTFSQTNGIKAFHPSLSRCKQPSDVCNDNFSIHRPLFSSPPLFQPLFSNIFIPPNLNPSQSCASPTSPFLEDQEKPPRRTNSTMNFMFYHNNSLGGKLNEDACFKKMENIQTENGKQPRSTSFPERGSLPFPSPCELASPVPWTYSPFIMPLFSYYVFWHSQFSNNKIPPPNSFLQCDPEKVNKNCESAHEKINRNNSKKKEEENEEFWHNNEKTDKNEWKTGHDITGSSTSFVSIISLDYGEETFLNPKKKNDIQKPTKNEIDNLILDSESVDKIHLEKKYQHQKAKKISDGKRGPPNQSGENLCKENYKNQPCIPIFSDEHSNDDAGYCTISEPKKTENEKTESSTLDIQIETVDALSEGEYSYFQNLQEKMKDSKEKKRTKPKPKERTTKKSLKNFTMADDYHLQKEVEKNMAMAAGGDLGEENCAAYEVKISPIKNLQEKVDETENKKDEENTILEQNTEETSKNERVNSTKEEEIKKISRSNTRSWPNSKSRIAKLTPNFKNKDVTPQTIEKQEIEKEGTVTKRKHNCLTTGSNLEIESDSKIQKIKNCETVQDQNRGGANKKNSKSKTKNKSYKKEGKKSKFEKQNQNSPSEEDSVSSSKT